jgi:hypothetical protein
VAAVTPVPPFSARDTDATDTLASRATSLMVAAAMRARPQVRKPLGEANVNVFMAACKVLVNTSGVATHNDFA